MIPGFVNIDKDEDGFVHLYFYPGIGDNDEPIYRDMTLKNIPFTYTCSKNSDSSIDYKFDNKSIIRIKCQLVPVDSSKEIEYKTLEIKDND